MSADPPLERPEPDGPVLVVDDDRQIREVIVTRLTHYGFSTETAANGREALDYLLGEGSRPCAIVLDLIMPVMTGEEFRAEQRATPAIADIPVIVLTGADQPQTRADPLHPVACLVKPADLTVLPAFVMKHCRRRS
jgi:CheY-like chemotaxis protein